MKIFTTKTFLISIFSFLAINCFCQVSNPNSFAIKNNSSTEKSGFYKSSIAKANMENYRLREQNVEIEFEEGFTCVLFSAKSLADKGIKVDVDSYQTDFPSNYGLPVFSILPDGHLVAKYTKRTK